MFISDTPTASQWAALDTSDHSSREWTILIVNGVFLGLVAVVILLRILTKIMTVTKLFLDDYLMLLSAVLFTAFCSLNVTATSLGFGTHIWDLTNVTTTDDIANTDVLVLAAAVAPAQQLNYAALALGPPTVMLAKLSVLAILVRIFPSGSGTAVLRTLLFVLGAIIVGCCTSQALLVVFQCWPVRASWETDLIGGAAASACTVKPLETITLALGALNVVTNLIICVAPIPRFLELKIERPQKACLCALFLTGLVACVISVFRVLSLRGLKDNLDVTYAIAPYLNWSVCEAALIIMTGCVPSLRPLLATILPRFFRLPYYSRFSTLFSGKRGTMMAAGSSPRPHHMQSADSWRPESSSAESTKGLGVGTITITKEYHIEASQRQQRPGSIWPGTRPMTPGARFAARAIVTCEKSRSP